MTDVLRTFAVAWVIGVLLASAAVARDDVPGASDAIQKAIEAAAADAVDQVLQTLPGDVVSIAFGPLFRDPEGGASNAVEHALIQMANDRGLKVVTRQDADWAQMIREWVFTEDNFDVMPEALLPEFRSVLPAGAVVWGNLDYARLDDSGYRGQASIHIWLLVVATGQKAGSGHGQGLEYVDWTTFLLAMTQEVWFWPAVVIAVVVAVVIIIVVVPLRRKMALAAKPREIMR